jgi:hypothetical protein
VENVVASVVEESDVEESVRVNVVVENVVAESDVVVNVVVASVVKESDVEESVRMNVVVEESDVVVREVVRASVLGLGSLGTLGLYFYLYIRHLYHDETFLQ